MTDAFASVVGARRGGSRDGDEWLLHLPPPAPKPDLLKLEARQLRPLLRSRVEDHSLGGTPGRVEIVLGVSHRWATPTFAVLVCRTPNLQLARTREQNHGEDMDAALAAANSVFAGAGAALRWSRADLPVPSA